MTFLYKYSNNKADFSFYSLPGQNETLVTVLIFEKHRRFFEIITVFFADFLFESNGDF